MKQVKFTEKNILKFLDESNKIEGVYDQAALDDAFEAWGFLSAQDKLTLTNIRYTHALLLRFIFPETAGSFRNVNVRVGLRICPDWTQINELMKKWISLHANAKTEKQIKLAHVVFEHTHPFQDGNGRVGRMIMNWQRQQNKLPLLIICEGKDQLNYYKWF